MATFIQAFGKFGARLKREPTVRLEELADRIAELTGQRPSQVTATLLVNRRLIVSLDRRPKFHASVGSGGAEPAAGGKGLVAADVAA
jgi:hypothetical protein